MRINELCQSYYYSLWNNNFIIITVYVENAFYSFRFDLETETVFLKKKNNTLNDFINRTDWIIIAVKICRILKTDALDQKNGCHSYYILYRMV